jgi:hypothetical protein
LIYRHLAYYNDQHHSSNATKLGRNEGVGFEEVHRAEPWPAIARTWTAWQQVKEREGLADLAAVAVV